MHALLISLNNLFSELSGIPFTLLQMIAEGDLMEFMNWKENHKISNTFGRCAVQRTAVMLPPRGRWTYCFAVSS